MNKKLFIVLTLIAGLIAIGVYFGIREKPLGELPKARLEIVFPDVAKGLPRAIKHRNPNNKEPDSEVFVEAKFYAKDGTPIINAEVEAVATQAMFNKRFTQAPYVLDYFATSSGIHTIEFFMFDPDAPVGSNAWVKKSIEFFAE